MTKCSDLRLRIESDRGLWEIIQIICWFQYPMHLMHICARENIFLAQHGEVDCWPLDCPPTPSCLAPVLVPGACCPSCPACNNNSSCGPHAGWSTITCNFTFTHEYILAGLLRQEGDSWRLPSAPCTSCLCKVFHLISFQELTSHANQSSSKINENSDP